MTSLLNTRHYNTARPHQGVAQCIPGGEGDSGHLTRRLTPRRLAGHLPNPIFERDTMRILDDRSLIALKLPADYRIARLGSVRFPSHSAARIADT